ncbi:hypothetical protein CROQUDRAFT_651885 [Cronartium quercuum f. sp. fusiforme G11]|uniref:MHD domain-containing protein n=1 Tax=Cronartium quercuum f. sp. fusiforme G11 TaxID=708437 RepID=A0A9P6NS82_9BASI|nr:hypothetical protein CROQUDRAFT_651885 [Cronartium quercuum f. sp. fusiforme G11]
MEAILILDQAGQPILRSRFPYSAYPQAILDSLSHQIQQAQPNSNPIIHLPAIEPQCCKLTYYDDDSSDDSSSDLHSPIHNPVLENDHVARVALPKPRQLIGSIVCHVLRDDLRFAAVTTADLEPSTVFDFLDQFIHLLRFYLHAPSLSTTLIQTHFSLILQLLSLVAPPPGAPLALSSVSQLDLLTAILPQPSAGITTFLAQAADSLKRTTSSIANRPTTIPSPTLRSAPSLFTSPLPWRPVGLSYPNEEVYLDVCESLSATIDHSGSILSSSVGGRIDAQSKLSGMPELVLSFTDPTRVLAGVGFHPSVRHGRWLRDRTLSFIPPDRPFVLMSYRARPPSRLPLSSRVTVTLGEAGGTFKIELFATSVPLGKVCVRWSLGDGTSGLLSDRLIARGAESGSERWEWEERSKNLLWSLDSLNPSKSISLEGVWTHTSAINRPAPSILITFEIPPYGSGSTTISGLTVDRLVVSDPSSSSFAGPKQVQKGVRTKLENGRIEVRWC